MTPREALAEQQRRPQLPPGVWFHQDPRIKPTPVVIKGAVPMPVAATVAETLMRYFNQVADNNGRIQRRIEMARDLNVGLDAVYKAVGALKSRGEIVVTALGGLGEWEVILRERGVVLRSNADPTAVDPVKLAARPQTIAQRLRSYLEDLAATGADLPKQPHIAAILGIQRRQLSDALSGLRDYGIIETRLGPAGGPTGGVPEWTCEMVETGIVLRSAGWVENY